MANQDLNEIKGHPALLSVYTSRVQLKRDGAELVGRCPVHSEKTPSFRVSQHGGTWVWKCFGQCGTGGDAIAFVMKLDNIGFKDAVEKIKGELGTSFAETKRASKVFSSLSELEPKPARTYSLTEYQKLEQALLSSQAAREWLTSRGISYETARNAHLGFKQDVGKLAGESNKDTASGGWISFPCISGKTVLAIKYRSIVRKAFCKQPGMSKGDQTPLFNAETIEPLEPVFLVEGEIDALTLEMAGFRACSVQSSSTPLTAANKDLLLTADYIILAGDNTTDGNAYMEKVWSEIQERTFKLTWPEKDANDVFLKTCKGDLSKFRALVEELTDRAKSNITPGISSLQDSLRSPQGINIEDSPLRWRWPWPGMDAMVNIMPGSVAYLSSTNTSMGKSSLMMNASIFNALRGEVILNYSAELTNAEYAQIVVSHLLKKDRHKLTPADYQEVCKLLANIRYYIGCNNDLSTIMPVLDLIELGIRRSGAGTVILDTIHFVTTNEKDTVKAQENAMNRIKSMAQKYRVKWFNLGQPRKAQQSFKGKPLHVTDAKGSESLISASDAAFAIHRECARADDPDNPPREPYKPLTQVFLQKGRFQGTGPAYTELLFNGDICTFFPVTKDAPPNERQGLFT